MKTKITLLALAVLLAGCATAPEKTPTTVYIQEAPQIRTEEQTSYVASAAPVSLSATRSSVTPKEAASVCETDVMRSRVVDGNDHNDSVRMMVVQDNESSSEVLSEVEINCRDYFLRKNVKSSEPTLVQTSNQTFQSETKTSVANKNSSYTYIVHRGDTVWNIAREHCTTVKAISRLNGLGKGNVIDVGQRLKMPAQNCN